MKTVLVVDDYPDFTETVSELLTLNGHRPLTACSWEKAQKILNTVQIDLLMIDLNLYDVTIKILSETVFSMPVIIVSADTVERIEKAMILLKTNYSLRKPFKAQELWDIMSVVFK